MFPVRSGQRAGEQRKPASFADHLRRDLKRAFGIEALRPVEMLRANGRRDTRAKWVEVRPLTPREREIFEETEFTLLMISKTRGNSVNFTGEDGAQDGELHR